MINSLYVSHLLMLMALLEIAHLSVAALAEWRSNNSSTVCRKVTTQELEGGKIRYLFPDFVIKYKKVK